LNKKEENTMKRILFVSAILGTSFSHGMEDRNGNVKNLLVKRLSLGIEGQPVLKKSPRLPVPDDVQQAPNQIFQPARSPRQSLSEQLLQLNNDEKEKQNIYDHRPASNPIEIKGTQVSTVKIGPDIIRARAQSNGSPKFIGEENMYAERLLREQKLRNSGK
jgi:hypothetical protein